MDSEDDYDIYLELEEPKIKRINVKAVQTFVIEAISFYSF